MGRRAARPEFSEADVKGFVDYLAALRSPQDDAAYEARLAADPALRRFVDVLRTATSPYGRVLFNREFPTTAECVEIRRQVDALADLPSGRELRECVARLTRHIVGCLSCFAWLGDQDRALPRAEGRRAGTHVRRQRAPHRRRRA